MAVESILGDSAQIVLDSPVAGQARVTLNSITYNPGTNELLVIHNGQALTLGLHYTEEDGTHVILLFLPDATGPDVDEFRFQTIVQGSSTYIPPPQSFTQLDATRRPGNFGGRFVYDS